MFVRDTPSGLMVGPDSIKILKGEGFLWNTVPIGWMRTLRLKRLNSLPMFSHACERKDLNLGSLHVNVLSFHYTAHIKCTQMHAHVYENITKNSTGSCWPPRRKGKRNQKESGKDKKRKGKYAGSLNSLFPLEISDTHRGKSDIFLPLLWPQRSLSCQAVDKRSGFSLEPGVTDLLLPALQN